MNLHIFKSVPELNDALIGYVIEIANKSIAEKGSFNFVLTGGNSPKELYLQLATTYKNEIDWSKVYFFFGDERAVLPSHKDYNGLMAKENLFIYLQTPPSHIFHIDTTLSPENAATAYKKALEEHFQGKPIVFDLVLLGMGDDAHTASIFPGTDLVHNEEETVAAVWVEKLNTFRISLSAPLINKAKNVAFITFGKSKSAALAKVLGKQLKDPNTYPAQLINPIDGNLAWFVDEQAASLL